MPYEEFSIQDLCDQTGLPRRTIHFYIQQGILPPPSGSGLGARYQREHLLRLQSIPILRQQGLRLDDIRQKFSHAESSELERLVKESPAVMASSPSPSIPEPASGTPYLVYTLPDGIILMIPNNLPAETRQKAHQLLQAAQQVFSTSPDFSSF